MTIIQITTGKIFPVEIIPVEKTDFRLLKKNRYFFDWEEEKSNEIYKLILKGTNDILGLVSIERIPEEVRVHIRLLSVSIENKGKEKEYDRIVGNLMAFVAKIAVAEFAEDACISLIPKSQIVRHYVDKFNMKVTGRALSLEVPELLDLINEYDRE